jgi:hypothetical protein
VDHEIWLLGPAANTSIEALRGRSMTFAR